MNDEKDKLTGNTKLGDNATGNAIFQGDVKQDFVQRDKIVYEAPKPGLLALHQLEPPPVDFVGREAELAELLAMVKQGGVTISGLQGLGGVGKTTLALKLASLLKADYPDAQFFLDLKGPEENPLPATEALKHVIRAYHPTVVLPESQKELRAQYLSVLEGQRVLLLMDNARDETQIKPLLPPPECLLLVTSRFHFTVPGLKVKSLDALPPKDAIKLLVEIAPRIGDHASEIAILCGNLPLGLRVAASFITQRSNFKVEKLVSKLRENREWMEPIQASLSLSYQLLSDRLKRNWITLCVFPDSFDQLAVAAVWKLDEEQTQEQLGDLLNFSLVEWNEETDRYRLHDLARVFADSRISVAERLTYYQHHAEYFLQMLMVAEGLYLQGGGAFTKGLSLFDQEWSNTRAGWEWAKCHADTNSRALALCSQYPAQCNNIFALRQSPRENIEWRNVALAATQRLGDKRTEGLHISHLGIAFRELGDLHQAIKLQEQSLSIAREIGYREGEGRSLGELGNCYEFLGNTQLAIDFYEKALDIARQLNDRTCEASVLNSLGNIHLNLGNGQQAIEFYGDCLTFARQTGSRRDEGIFLSNLSGAYSVLGEPQLSSEFFEQALGIFREIGDRSEGVLLWNRAKILARGGNRAQAITYAEAAQEIFQQIEHRELANVCKRLEEWRSQEGAANE